MILERIMTVGIKAKVENRQVWCRSPPNPFPTVCSILLKSAKYKTSPRLAISSVRADPRLSSTAAGPISALNTNPATHTDRHPKHDLAIVCLLFYMYCQIAPRSTIDPADDPHPSHLYYTLNDINTRVYAKGIKAKVENRHVWCP